jgi:quercetin dioxygenase-like cupin family protein
MHKSQWLALLMGLIAIEPVSDVHGQAPAASQKIGVSSVELYEARVPETRNMEVTVLDVRYLPEAINPRHFHPAAVTFYIVSGTPVFQVEGKEPVTLKPGDSLLVPAGTTHAHWNPSKTEGVRWLEFIVAEKGKGRAIRKP